MATIYGQNVRLKAGGRAVAAAKSCALHVAARTEEVSSKDTEGGWAEYAVTGHGWDMQADAVVTEADGFRTVDVRGRLDWIGYSESCTCEELGVKIPKGGRVTVRLESGEAGADTEVYFLNGRMTGSPLAEPQRSASLEYTYPTGNTMLNRATTVWIAFNTVDLSKVHIRTDRVGGMELEDFMRAGEPMEVTMQVTGWLQNRDARRGLVSGMARVTDLTVNAAAGSMATYSVKMTGTGPLTISPAIEFTNPDAEIGGPVIGGNEPGPMNPTL